MGEDEAVSGLLALDVSISVGSRQAGWLTDGLLVIYLAIRYEPNSVPTSASRRD